MKKDKVSVVEYNYYDGHNKTYGQEFLMIFHDHEGASEGKIEFWELGREHGEYGTHILSAKSAKRITYFPEQVAQEVVDIYKQSYPMLDFEIELVQKLPTLREYNRLQRQFYKRLN